MASRRLTGYYVEAIMDEEGTAPLLGFARRFNSNLQTAGMLHEQHRGQSPLGSREPPTLDYPLALCEHQMKLLVFKKVTQNYDCRYRRISRRDDSCLVGTGPSCGDWAPGCAEQRGRRMADRSTLGLGPFGGCRPCGFVVPLAAGFITGGLAFILGRKDGRSDPFCHWRVDLEESFYYSCTRA